MLGIVDVRRGAQAISLDEIQRLLTDVERRHVPYAQQRAVNATLFEVRGVVQDKMSGIFILRRQWAKRGVRVAKAPKGGSGAVYTLDWFMADQEAGAVRRPRHSRFLWRPTLAIRRGGTIAGLPSKRPKTLKRQAHAAAQRGRRRRRGTPLKPTPFLMTMKTGKRGLFIRRGSRRTPIVLLYALEDQEVIPPVWRFQETAARVTDKALRRHFVLEMQAALAGNRTNGKAAPLRSGLLDYLSEFPASMDDTVRHFGSPA